jgi:hypothetical protein
MEKTKKTQPSPELSRRVATYSALASAAMLASPAADAALQIWPVNQTLSPAAFFESASFNGAFSIGFASSGSNESRGDRYFWGPNNNLSFISSSTLDGARLSSGVAVSASVPASQSGWQHAESTQNTNNDLHYDWHPGDQGYLGIRFNNGAGDYNYGWVDVTMNADESVTINRWALDDVAGTPAITPGAVPEPGTGALLALLAMGATGLRRRRQSAAV